MNLSRLEIRQTFMKLGWEIKQPSYTFETGNAEINIDQSPAEMTINPIASRLTIDQSQCWADMDLKHIFQRVEEEAQEGEQEVLRYIAKNASEGVQLGELSNNRNVIAKLAEDVLISSRYNIAYRNVPRNFSLKMDFTPAQLNMDWKAPHISVDVNRMPFQHHYEKGKIDYDVLQKNQLNINVVGGSFNTAW